MSAKKKKVFRTEDFYEDYNLFIIVHFNFIRDL